MNHRVRTVVVTNVESQRRRADVTVAPDQQRTEDGLGEEIQDSVKDTLGVDGDDVSSLTQAPGDGVESPEERGERSTDHKGLAGVGADTIGVLPGLPDQDVEDVEQSGTAESKVSPFVAGRNEGSDETRDDHDLVDQDDEEGGGPGHSRGEEQVHEEERSGDDPIDVSNVVDFTVDTGDLGVTSQELDVDGCPAQVGGHGEVGNGGDHGDGCGDVVEDTICWVESVSPAMSGSIVSDSIVSTYLDEASSERVQRMQR